MTRKPIVPVLITLTASLSTLACSGRDASLVGDGSGQSGQSQNALTASVPQREWLQMDVASLAGTSQTSQTTQSSQAQASASAQATPQAPSCQPLGPSGMAILTHTIAANADSLIGGVLGTVAQITSGPPAEIDPGHAVWGPITGPGSPAVFRLDVVAVGPNAFHFQLSGKPQGADDSQFRGVFQGTTVAPDPQHRAGDLTIDFGAMSSLDPANNPVSGGVAIHFDNTQGPRIVDAQFSGITGPGAPQPDDAHYHLEQAPDTSASFHFVTRTDFDQNGSLNELLQVESAWAASGAGAAHVNVSGGDLGPRQVNAVECWAPPLVKLFYADDVNQQPPQGNPACCSQ